MTRLRRSFFERDAVQVARELLGKVFVAGPCSGRIVETEAYRPDDPASHSHRGETKRNSAMFGPAGRLYVYFTYGMHFCANVVTGQSGDGSAVLIRAVSPIDGASLMRERRGAARSDHDLTNGPAKLCQAFGLTLEDNGVDLLTSRELSIIDDGVAPPSAPGVSTRVGISLAQERMWRFFIDGDPYVSRAAPPSGRRTSAP